MRARRRSNFLSLRRKKVTKERATLLSATPSLRCGATWVLRCRVRRGTHFAAAQLRSDNPGEPDNKACVSCGTHTTPHPARPGAYRREPKKTGHRCARHPTRGRAQRWPVWASPPSGCAEERRGWRTRARDCLSAAGASSSETPPAPSTAGCPGAARRGRRQRGRFLLPSFLGETRKEGAPPGAHPGLHPWRKHHILHPQQSTACTVPTAAQDDVCAKCPRDVKKQAK